MTEQELFEFEISKRSAFTLDRGVVISQPNQIYFFGREDYVVPEDEEISPDTPDPDADFDYKNYVAPEGYTLVDVVNLNGGSITIGSSTISESFGVVVDENNVAHPTFDLSVGLTEEQSAPTKDGYEFLGYMASFDGEIRISTACFVKESDIKTSGSIDITIDWTPTEPDAKWAVLEPTEETLDLSLSDSDLWASISSLISDVSGTSYVPLKGELEDSLITYIRSLKSGDRVSIKYQFGAL